MTEAPPVGYTVDEIMCTAIARNVVDGEVLAQGLATPLVAAGYLLAWHTHAPNVYFASAIGQSVCREGAPLGLVKVESLWLDKAMRSFGFVAAVADILPAAHAREYFRPGQVDSAGNFNNIAIGRDYRRPRLRLPGTGGIPDVTTFMDNVCLYVTRHSRVTFVDKLDFVSGLGHNHARRRGRGPVYLVSDLGQFDFVRGRMRLTHLHPGVIVERVQAKTGFALEVASPLETTEPPGQRELQLLREVIDPLGIRKLEFMSGPERRKALRGILQREAAS
jgi:acyl CoA:acetate/3-ketoacid CoA transferase beta subunit